MNFRFHQPERRAFRSFSLPRPSALEIFAGALKMGVGLPLAPRRAVVPAATLLGVTMVVAIISSGIGHGDVIPNLTLAPTLLMATWSLLVWPRARGHRPGVTPPGDPLATGAKLRRSVVPAIAIGTATLVATRGRRTDKCVCNWSDPHT